MDSDKGRMPFKRISRMWPTVLSVSFGLAAPSLSASMRPWSIITQINVPIIICKSQ